MYTLTSRSSKNCNKATSLPTMVPKIPNSHCAGQNTHLVGGGHLWKNGWFGNRRCVTSSPTLMPWSHQTFYSVPSMKLLKIMLKNRCWPSLFTLLLSEMSTDGTINDWWSAPQSTKGATIHNALNGACLAIHTMCNNYSSYVLHGDQLQVPMEGNDIEWMLPHHANLKVSHILI